MFNKVLANMALPVMVDIKGYEGLYAVTDDGRVWSYPKATKHNGKMITLSPHRSGYITVELSKNGKQKRFYVHRLVAQAFIPNEKKEVNHKNGIKTDNRVENLEWVTSSENKLHAEKMMLTNHSLLQKKSVSLVSNRSNYGSSNMIKISEDEASEICEAYDTGMYSYKNIAMFLNVDKSTIHLILKGYKNATTNSNNIWNDQQNRASIFPARDGDMLLSS